MIIRKFWILNIANYNMPEYNYFSIASRIVAYIETLKADTIVHISFKKSCFLHGPNIRISVFGQGVKIKSIFHEIKKYVTSRSI